MALIVIAGVHSILLSQSAISHSIAVDETGHLISGLQYWSGGEFKTYIVNPPVAKLWMTFPVLALNPVIVTDPKSRFEHNWQDQHLGFVRHNPAIHVYVIVARLSLIPVSILGMIVVACWSRQLYGPLAGVLSAVFWATNPGFLGWGSIANVDVFAATAAVSAMYCVFEWRANPTWGTTLATGVFLGLALLVKFSLVVLWPATFLVVAVRRGCFAWHRLGLLKCAALVAISISIINIGYAFHSVGSRLDRLSLNSNVMTKVQEGLPWARFPLPDAFVVGMDEQKSHADAGYSTYFRGSEYDRGFWYYYFYAALIKEPLPFIGSLILLLPAFCGKARKLSWEKEGILISPVIALLTILSLEDGMHLHYRYLIPALPFLFILSGAFVVAEPSSRSAKRRNAIAVVFVLWSFTIAIQSHPNGIGYFNSLVGGSRNGWHHLADSNIDWGQDLLLLKEWQDEFSPDAQVRLAYFGSVNPRLYGIHSCSPDDSIECDRNSVENGNRSCERSKYLVVSVNLLLISRRPKVIQTENGLRVLSKSAFESLRRRKPDMVIGTSMFVYKNQCFEDGR